MLAWPELQRAFARTAYMGAAARAQARSAALQDAGIVRALPDEQGVVLTVDLCPSRKPLRALFAQVIEAFRGVEQPVPVGVSITGVWMREHPADLQWLPEGSSTEVSPSPGSTTRTTTSSIRGAL